MRLVQPRRVHDDHLEAGAREDGAEPVPRGLHRVGGDGDLLAHDGVQKRRLARVRAADERDEARPEAFFPERAAFFLVLLHVFMPSGGISAATQRAEVRQEHRGRHGHRAAARTRARLRPRSPSRARASSRIVRATPGRPPIPRPCSGIPPPTRARCTGSTAAHDAPSRPTAAPSATATTATAACIFMLRCVRERVARAPQPAHANARTSENRAPACLSASLRTNPPPARDPPPAARRRSPALPRSRSLPSPRVADARRPRWAHRSRRRVAALCLCGLRVALRPGLQDLGLALLHDLGLVVLDVVVAAQVQKAVDQKQADLLLERGAELARLAARPRRGRSPRRPARRRDPPPASWPTGRRPRRRTRRTARRSGPPCGGSCSLSSRDGLVGRRSSRTPRC